MNSADVSTYPGSKYYDLYQYCTTTTDYKKSRLGDATGETRGWNTRCSMVTSSKPWFVRGGGCYYGFVVNTGAFVYCVIDTGKADTYYSTRPIITQIS